MASARHGSRRLLITRAVATIATPQGSLPGIRSLIAMRVIADHTRKTGTPFGHPMNDPAVAFEVVTAYARTSERNALQPLSAQNTTLMTRMMSSSGENTVSASGSSGAAVAAARRAMSSSPNGIERMSRTSA